MAKQALKEMTEVFAKQMMKFAKQHDESMKSMIMQLQAGYLQQSAQKFEGKFFSKIEVFNGDSNTQRRWRTQ